MHGGSHAASATRDHPESARRAPAQRIGWIQAPLPRTSASDRQRGEQLEYCMTFAAFDLKAGRLGAARAVTLAGQTTFHMTLRRFAAPRLLKRACARDANGAQDRKSVV